MNVDNYERKKDRKRLRGRARESMQPNEIRRREKKRVKESEEEVN